MHACMRKSHVRVTSPSPIMLPLSAPPPPRPCAALLLPCGYRHPPHPAPPTHPAPPSHTQVVAVRQNAYLSGGPTSVNGSDSVLASLVKYDTETGLATEAKPLLEPRWGLWLCERAWVHPWVHLWAAMPCHTA